MVTTVVGVVAERAIQMVVMSVLTGSVYINVHPGRFVMAAVVVPQIVVVDLAVLTAVEAVAEFAVKMIIVIMGYVYHIISGNGVIFIKLQRILMARVNRLG